MWLKPDASVRLLLKRYFTVFVVLHSALSAVAQDPQPRQDPPRRGSSIVNDTLKQIYGPKTSRYFYEADIFFNRDRLHPIDTAIRNFHRFDFVQTANNLVQHVGVLAGPLKPIYGQQPETIGVRVGMPVYEPYWDSRRVRYFDTRSPYTYMRVIIGYHGRSITEASYSRNINPRWNVGVNYRGIFVDKQVGYEGKGVRYANSNYYDLYTTYQSPDSAYRVFGSLRRMFHKVKEFGGVRFLADTTLEGYFDRNAAPWLTDTESNDLRIHGHLFHQYRVGAALQAYHTLDRYSQKNNFINVSRPDTDPYWDFMNFELDSIRDAVKMTTLRNEFGIKGNISRVFYNGYYAIRNYHFRNNRFQPDSTSHITYDSLGFPTGGNEHYLGGRIELNLDSIGRVTGGMEVMGEGNYQVYGEIRSKWFEARLRQMRYKPDFVAQAYRGAYDAWNNTFADTESTRLNGYLHYRSSVLGLSPGLTFTRLNNYVFYRKVSDVDTVQQVLPVQSSGNQIIASPELRMRLTFFRHIDLTTQVIYTRLLENAGDAISVPEFLVNAQLAWSNIFFNGNLDFQFGVDLHVKSDYYADGYDVASRQFYRQDDFLVESFPLIDVFLNVKVKRGRLFFKFHNFVQAFQDTGYFPTPYYPGQRPVFDFGFDWSFYD